MTSETIRRSFLAISAGTAAAITFGTGWQTISAQEVADRLATQIEENVRQAISAVNAPPDAADATKLESLAVTAEWKELWPDDKQGEATRSVKSKVWNAPIQAALAEYGAVYLPKHDTPYYIDAPIVLRSGQRLPADRDAEIRLVPGTNTCMVRNERLVNGSDRPLPANRKPDTQILIEGGVWCTRSRPANRNPTGMCRVGQPRGRWSFLATAWFCSATCREWWCAISPCGNRGPTLCN